nr:TadE/TadG family type IV pilus assembly protein [uncultured Cohaesibacter sp.]
MKLLSNTGLLKYQGFLQRPFTAAKRAFVKDTDGATTVEFVILITPFLAFLYMLLSMGYLYLNATMLEDGTQTAGRQIRIGAVANSNMQISDFKKLICNSVGISQESCLSDIKIDVTSSPDISTLDTGDDDDDATEIFEPGDPSDYVIVKAKLPMATVNNFFKLFGSSSETTFTISSVLVFRNEPYE